MHIPAVVSVSDVRYLVHEALKVYLKVVVVTNGVKPWLNDMAIYYILHYSPF